MWWRRRSYDELGKSKAKMYDSNKRRVRFSDVAGADEEKQELIEIGS